MVKRLRQATNEPPPRILLRWVGVGWKRRCKTRQSLRELDNQGAVFVWGGVGSPWLAAELDHLSRLETLNSLQGE